MNMPDTKNKTDISVDDQVAKIFTWRRGFNAVFLIDIGVELGLFKALAEKPGRTAPFSCARTGESIERHSKRKNTAKNAAA